MSIMCGEIDVLLSEFLKELLAEAGELDADPLHSVAELRGDGLYDGYGAILEEVHFLDAILVEVLQEAGVGHAGRSDALLALGLFIGGTSRGRSCGCGCQKEAAKESPALLIGSALIIAR